MTTGTVNAGYMGSIARSPRHVRNYKLAGITKEEWSQVVYGDPDLEWVSGSTKLTARWKGHPNSAVVIFSYDGGEISVMIPDYPTLDKMRELATTLGSTLNGPDDFLWNTEDIHTLARLTADPKPPKAKVVSQTLVWPGAAGSVAWSACQVFIEGCKFDQGTLVKGMLARMSALILIAIYLGYSWLRTESRITFKWGYWVLDWLHVLSIVVLSILMTKDIPSEQQWVPERIMYFLFGVAIAGHLSGVWDDTEQRNMVKRFVLAGCSGMGAVAVFASHRFYLNPFPTNIPLALSLALLCWVSVRKFVYPVRN